MLKILKKSFTGIVVIILLCLGLFVFLPNVSAQVVVNEIMYNPNQGDDDYNEWIELYAIADLSLENWSICGSQLQAGYIKKSDGQIYQSSGFSVTAGQYIIITDGGSGTEVYEKFAVNPSAIALHSTLGSLCDGLSNDPGKTIELTNNSGSTVETVSYLKSWGAGGDGNSLERKSATGPGNDSTNWQVSANFGGTPGGANSSGATPAPTPTTTDSPTSTPTPSPTPSPTPTPTKTPTPKLTPTKTATPRPTPSEESNSEELVLGLRSQLDNNSTGSSEILSSETEKKFPIFAIFFILGGLTFSGLAVFSFLKSKKNEYTSEGNETEKE